MGEVHDSVDESLSVDGEANDNRAGLTKDGGDQLGEENGSSLVEIGEHYLVKRCDDTWRM